MSQFKQYIEHGWQLVAIPPGQKGPVSKGWNQRENAITNPETALRGAGLAHAYSGTCAIDIDDFEAASDWLAERGVDLAELFNAPDAVQIVSGRANHGKLMYALPEPLTTKVIKDADKQVSFEFRCATAGGKTVQDVLPPSIHPNTGEPYKWYYDEAFAHWTQLPPLPKALHDIWLSEISAVADLTVVPDKGAALDELRELLTHQDPNMSRDEWVQVGMAIHHETDGSLEGLQLWDEWSKGSDKYVGGTDVEIPWRSFHDSPHSVTVGMLRQGSVATADEFPHIDTQTPLENDPWAAVAQQNRERFKLVQVAEIAEREPPEWIVDEIMQKADISIIFGPPGAGKSFVTLDLAFSIATGFTWFNKRTVKGPVVWIAAEAAGAMRNRAKAYGISRGIKLENTDLWVIEQTLSLMDEQDAIAVTEAVTEKMPKLIVVDTLAAASGGANENSGEDMNKVLNSCRKLHEATGALVLLVHHSGKDASRGARGWSGLKAAAHSEYELTYNPDSPIRVMTTTKQRDGVEGERYPFKLVPVPLDFDDITSCVVEPMDPSMLDGNNPKKLGGVQKIVFDIIYETAGEANNAVHISAVYDGAIIQMPAPADMKRDRRQESIQRALSNLHERGYITVSGDSITVGSLIHDDQE